MCRKSPFGGLFRESNWAILGSICRVRREFGGFLEAFLLGFARLRSGLQPNLRSYAVTRVRTI